MGVINQFKNTLLFWVLAAVLLIGAGYTHYLLLQRDLIEHTKKKFDAYLQNAEREVEFVFRDATYLAKLLNIFDSSDLENQEDLERLVRLSKRPYTIFIFHGNDLLFWSNDEAQQPDPESLKRDNPYFSDPNGNYYRILVEEKEIADKNYLAVASIPIRLGSRAHPYAHISSNIPEGIQLTTNPGTPIVTSSGDEFLYLEPYETSRLTKQDVRILLLLYGMAFLALIVLIQRVALLILDRVGVWESIGFLVFTAVGIRLVSILFDLTNQFNVIESFDAALMQPAFSLSLADILINIVLGLWISVYVINYLQIKVDASSPLLRRILIVLGCYGGITLGLVYLANLCQELIQNTSIDFNFESVFNLDRISILSLVGIILVLFTQFIWSAKLVSIVQQLEVPTKFKIGASITALALAWPAIHVFNPAIPLIPFILVAGIFILLLDIFLEVKTPNFTWIVLWLVVLSGFSSILLFKFNRDKDIEIRTKIAKSLSERMDTLALNEVLKVVKMVEEPLAKVRTRTQIRNLLSQSLLDFSSYLKSYYHIEFPKASSLNGSEELRWKDHTFYQKKEVLDHYFIAIEGGGGTKVLTSLSKQANNPYSPLPSLVPNLNFKGIDILNEYEYAVYDGPRCIERSSSGYRMVLEESVPDVGEISLVYPAGRSELIYNNGEYTVMVGKKLTGLIKPVSLFSYLFVIIVVMILSLLIFNSLFPYLPQEFNFTLSNQISLRNKIQVSVLTLIILSFIIIGIVTVFYFQNTAEKGNMDKLKQTASSLQYEIQENIKNDKTEAFDSIFKSSVRNLAIKYNSHIQLYDVNGLLVQTSDEEAVAKGYLSNRMGLDPLIALKKFSESISIYDRIGRKGEEKFKCAYLSLVTDSNKALGYVGLPVYPGTTDAADQVKDFMGTLLNVYVFLLLIAGAFALAVANSITRPMTVLGQKLKDFKLGKSNEPLEWNTKDELGVLIQEYNQMIIKLDESADLLALTEREVAWREMAKQVAHEIKNPLTPMRLSIQHLQHAMQNADPIESRQLVQRVGITLIEQIDNLSRIAAEFSTFAKMPKPQYERIILNDLVASVHDLFKKRDDMDFNLYVPIDEIFVNADKSHLLRVLNNLIKNAIQAIPASRRGVIDIKLGTRMDRAIIQVCDNGKGISREMKDKVFYPNFTTKTSGTGLGLAISKNIIESFGGRIYFETEEGIGTKFFFELPLLKNSEVEFREAVLI